MSEKHIGSPSSVRKAHGATLLVSEKHIGPLSGVGEAHRAPLLLLVSIWIPLGLGGGFENQEIMGFGDFDI